MNIKNIKRVFRDNGFYGMIFSFKNIINRIYNIIFLKKYNIQADISTFIYGLKYIKTKKVRIGKNCRIEIITLYSGNEYRPLLVIGDNVILNDNVHIACADYIEIGDNCLFASNIFISDHNHGNYNKLTAKIFSQKVVDRDLTLKSVKIGNNVWLGEGVIVLPGSIIGDNTIIGANSVVHGKIEANSIAVGSPAHVIKRRR